MEKRWIWPFELEEQIGAGAMGQVYRARFVKNDRRVALKLLPPDVAANKTLTARFQREMELLKDLKHPNIVHCFGGTCEGDLKFYAMELIEGGTLAALIDEQGRIPWRQAVEFGLQICESLQYAHDRDIIHRDLKPANLLISKGGRLKLSDFGLAQMTAESRLTAAGKTMGSLHYMAPEQIQGKPPLSNRTDLYALGCVMFEMLTGRPPFRGGAMAEVLQRHCKEAPVPVSTIALDCPPQLEALIAQLLSKDPAARPADAAAVAVRLREIDHSISVKMPRGDRVRQLAAVGAPSAPENTQTAEVPTTGARPSRWMLLACVAALIGLAVSIVQGVSAGAPFRQSQQLLARGLRDPNIPVRMFTLKTLGELGPNAEGTVPDLLEVVKSDADPLVRAEAALTLGKINTGGEGLLAPLTVVQRDDPFPQVREAAGKAIAELRKQPARTNWTAWIAALSCVVALVAGGAWGWKKLST